MITYLLIINYFQVNILKSLHYIYFYTSFFYVLYFSYSKYYFKLFKSNCKVDLFKIRNKFTYQVLYSVYKIIKLYFLTEPQLSVHKGQLKTLEVTKMDLHGSQKSDKSLSDSNSDLSSSRSVSSKRSSKNSINSHKQVSLSSVKRNRLSSKASTSSQSSRRSSTNSQQLSVSHASERSVKLSPKQSTKNTTNKIQKIGVPTIKLESSNIDVERLSMKSSSTSDLTSVSPHSSVASHKSSNNKNVFRFSLSSSDDESDKVSGQ